MANILNSTTAKQLDKTQNRYIKLSRELEKKGYIRESQNLRRAAESISKAANMLDRRYQGPEPLATARKPLSKKASQRRSITRKSKK